MTHFTVTMTTRTGSTCVSLNRNRTTGKQPLNAEFNFIFLFDCHAVNLPECVILEKKLEKHKFLFLF